jgi:hypothetical protein
MRSKGTIKAKESLVNIYLFQCPKPLVGNAAVFEI